MKTNILCRYGIPERIITDNGPNLNGTEVRNFCKKFQIKHHNSAPYRPQMNRAVKAVNKNIKKIIEKMTVTYKDWHEMLPYALHGYHATVRTSIGVTPYFLVFGMEAVTPIEMEIPSLRVLAKEILPNQEDNRGKWASTYEGPYVVNHAFSGGALILADMDGQELVKPINADAVKHYFA
ncbi:uncharacterized protein LOC129289081 [Prosopis cineraria]|uniref:uncharacterized protein LOC129289081 n=1 Tax=Prosopis cineraria TaxID=364024 RepID=UPI00241040D1|nr:uncharacterized protein LOC129289081 [Prosopis cineraria]